MKILDAPYDANDIRFYAIEQKVHENISEMEINGKSQ